jgi:ATP synthase protein I
LTRASLRRSKQPTIREAKVPDPEHQRRMAEFEKRLEAAKAAQAPKPRGDEHYSQAQLAWRMVIELVAGLAIGFGIGYGLDTLFGTMPFLLVTFTLLGFAAGIKTMLRSAREVEQARRAADRGDETDEGG